MKNIICRLIERYKCLRDAPDAVMISKDFNINCSVFRRDRRESPIWSIKKEGNSIEFSLIDAAVAIGTITSLICLISCISRMYCRIRYARRW
jgi:hypothetical protein